MLHWRSRLVVARTNACHSRLLGHKHKPALLETSTWCCGIPLVLCSTAMLLTLRLGQFPGDTKQRALDTPGTYCTYIVRGEKSPPAHAPPSHRTEREKETRRDRQTAWPLVQWELPSLFASFLCASSSLCASALGSREPVVGPDRPAMPALPSSHLIINSLSSLFPFSSLSLCFDPTCLPASLPPCMQPAAAQRSVQTLQSSPLPPRRPFTHINPTPASGPKKPLVPRPVIE